jgi:hypothetical protein
VPRLQAPGQCLAHRFRSLAAGTSAGQGSRQGQALGALCHRGDGARALSGRCGERKGGRLARNNELSGAVPSLTFLSQSGWRSLTTRR